MQDFEPLNFRPNLNGNSREQLMGQLYDVTKALTGVREALAAFDGTHGRNYQHIRGFDEQSVAQAADLDVLKAAHAATVAIDTFAMRAQRALLEDQA